MVLLSWFCVSTFGYISPSKLPSPQAVFKAFCYLAYSDGESKLWAATYHSVGRIIIASGIVMLIGIPIGIVMGTAPKINAILSPLVDPFRSAPIVALLPILVQWLGIGEEMKITFLVLGAGVYLIPMVRDAIKAVPEGYWTSIIDLGASPLEAVFKNTIPLALPLIS